MNNEQELSPDDAALSALIDDELPADETIRLRERLAREPDLAARLTALRRVDAAVRATLTKNEPPIPSAVLDLLKLRPAPVRTAEVLALKPARRFLNVPTALAAGVALALGFALALTVVPTTRTDALLVAVDASGRIENSSALYRVLETTPSNDSVAMFGDVVATPTMTFSRNGGGYCRLIGLASSTAETRTVACERDGEWRMEVAAFDAPVSAAANDIYRPAAATSSPWIEEAIDRLIDGAPLSSDAERELLRRGWK